MIIKTYSGRQRQSSFFVIFYLRMNTLLFPVILWFYICFLKTFLMSGIQEEFSALQLSLIAAQTDLERLDRSDTTLEELREYEETLRSIMDKLKKITIKVRADRSSNKQVWER